MGEASLHQLFCDSARASARQVAIIDPGRGHINYATLDALSSRVHEHLTGLGTVRGDRVAVVMRKSADAVAVLLGALKAGAAYVPVDASGPVDRAAYILDNCKVRAVIADADLAPRLAHELAALGAAPPMLCVKHGLEAGMALRAALEAVASTPHMTPAAPAAPARGDDLAYILYTSGSTGRPKGVMLSHTNAVSFVDWCSEAFEPRPDDRFSSHAPFHFDLSILDLHVCFKHGAALVLVNEDIGKDPPRLARLIADQRITIWYSAPSILSLLAQFGNLSGDAVPELRHVLFAGEVFPVKHLRALTALWPRPRYFNLYGPTETNVCTWHEVLPPVPAQRTMPYPIGRVCSHLRARVLDAEELDVPRGADGELCIAGPGVMQGYWAQTEQTACGFHLAKDGTRWYRTGDIVTEADDGCFTYLGRRDRMVKRRGYRVELGEVEATLYRQPRVKEAAVIAKSDSDGGVQIEAYLSCHGDKPPGLIEMKRFCADHMPLYMIPDRFLWLRALPKTSTDKIDYQSLKAAG